MFLTYVFLTLATWGPGHKTGWLKRNQRTRFFLEMENASWLLFETTYTFIKNMFIMFCCEESSIKLIINMYWNVVRKIPIHHQKILFGSRNIFCWKHNNVKIVKFYLYNFIFHNANLNFRKENFTREAWPSLAVLTWSTSVAQTSFVFLKYLYKKKSL